jgi:AI-2 transport protein TqsA
VLTGARRSLFSLAGLVILLAGLAAAKPIAVPILLALFTAFVSAPLVFRLNRLRIPYWLSVLLVLTAEVGVLLGLVLILTTPLGELRTRLPVYRTRLIDLTEAGAAWLRDRGLDVDASQLAAGVDPGSLFDLVGATVASLGAVLSSAVIALLLAGFTLFDAKRIWRVVEDHYAGTRAGDHVMSDVSDEVNRYLGVKSLTSGATGLFCGLWAGFLGVDFAILWGMLSFLLNYIPNVGALIATIPPFLIALVMMGPWAALALALGFLAVNMTIGSVIEPRIMGQALGLSPVVVLLSMVLWGWLLGPIGALLSVPITMVFKHIAANTEEWEWLAELASDRSQKAPLPPTAAERQSLSPPAPAPAAEE